jgi:hypothetical protein
MTQAQSRTGAVNGPRGGSKKQACSCDRIIVWRLDLLYAIPQAGRETKKTCL